jgi:hypothetical protein
MATGSARGDAYRDIIGTEDAVRTIERGRLLERSDRPSGSTAREPRRYEHERPVCL